MSSKTLLVLVLLIALTCSSNFYRKVIHNTDPQAKCLDGSGPMVYLHQGGDTSKILFYFLGGGACFGTDVASTLQSCYQRSSGMFGTSKVWPAQLEGDGLGILDPRASKNTFSNWTKIWIMYCDGSFHQGNNKGPIKYKDRELYFRGAVNTRSHFAWAHKTYNLTKADQIIVSGSSAGGIATFLWVDYVRTLVPNPQKVYGVSDSGIFYNPAANGLHEQTRIYSLLKEKQPNLILPTLSKNIDNPLFAQQPMQILIKISNTDEKVPNKECSEKISQEQMWKCLSIQFSYPTLRYPILFVQSNYDQYVIKNFLHFSCLIKGKSGYSLKNCNSSQMAMIQTYRKIVTDQIMTPLLNNNHSIWGIACSWHAEMYQTDVYDNSMQSVPKETGYTMRKAVEQFVIGNKRVQQIDRQPWPSNTPCSY